MERTVEQPRVSEGQANATTTPGSWFGVMGDSWRPFSQSLDRWRLAAMPRLGRLWGRRLPTLYGAFFVAWVGLTVPTRYLAILSIAITTVLLMVHLGRSLADSRVPPERIRWLLVPVGLIGLGLFLLTKSQFVWPDDLAVSLRYPQESPAQGIMGIKGPAMDLRDDEPIRISLPSGASDFPLQLGIHNKHRNLAIESSLLFVTFVDMPKQVSGSRPWHIQDPNKTLSYKFDYIFSGTAINADALKVTVDRPGRYGMRVDIVGKNISPMTKTFLLDVRMS